jgi:hypothetical protein
MRIRLCCRCGSRHRNSHPWCKPCQAAYYQERRKIPGYAALLAKRARDYRHQHPEHMKQLYRKHNLKNHSGATVEWYEKTFQKQKGRCAICNAPPRSVRKGGVPLLCADHKNKKLRGLLCMLCNFALNRIETIPDWGEKAHRYLRLATSADSL